MRILKRVKTKKTAEILLGGEHRNQPIYCPFCEENGESSRLFDMHQGFGKMEHKCDKCKYTILFTFDTYAWTHIRD